MERGEESGEEKAEFLWEKLRNVGKRGGHSTPAASFWRRNELHDSLGIISSRKLAAALWELHPLTDMRRRRVTAPPPPTLPESWSDSRRRAADLLTQHHRSIETSCSSSMKIAPRNAASFRASTEVLKVLNRVWSLEQQHVSDVSLIKALKKELRRTRVHAKELARDQQGELMKRTVGKNKAKVEPTREDDDELEHERKLRRQSESLQRELARELHEVKRSAASVSKELEKERSSRGFLEELCDELAFAVRDCERELGGRDDDDQLILRISQAWLDERMQQHRAIKNERNGNQMVGNNPMYRRSSLESIPLNLGASARREEEEDDDDDDDDDGSSSSHSTCFEVAKINECSLKPQGQKLEENHSDRRRAALSPSKLQAKFEVHAEAVERNACEYTSELDSNYAISNLIRYYHSFQENGMPVLEKLPSKFLPELKKETTSRGKLFEARSRGQKPRSRHRASIYPSRGE